MKITTWNVNSVRTRLDHVTGWLAENSVEVLCLQETKVVDADFPRSPFEALGYIPYVFGQKSYNGVALIAKTPLSEVQMGFTPVFAHAGLETNAAELLDQQKRVITGVAESGVRVVNLYVPNGNAIGSEKYAYKLHWFEVLYRYIKALLRRSPQGIVLCGDFNIALEDRDIHDPQGRQTHIMSSDAEREALRTLLALGFADAFRKFTTEAGHFSWWDYRAASFRRNRGWRIDHHYVTAELYEQAIACTIDCGPRQLEKPSDHTPVTLELACVGG
ncbi:exodeoxyribonuclease III [Lyngbya confervoides]|uniref:Exodeoxyribonuclease III n=1 Tax=Lyngbya confervoides BDU141951 TaxID=1574623 RepID=A0ABD4T8S8_9CYAN|nr:exodeoxyribonuclease III [Lyngbya confervoides]MCM1984725.1 exodeoxyribonuclease III [Lyngbya confervoides BDU141951]